MNETQMISRLGTETIVGLFALIVMIGIFKLIMAGYKIADARAGQFIAAQSEQTIVQRQQADAIGQLANDLRTGFDDQRESLIVMRMISRQLDEQRAEFKALLTQERSWAAGKRGKQEEDDGRDSEA